MARRRGLGTGGVLLLGGVALLAFTSGGRQLLSRFGTSPVPAGYTPVGGNYYRGPDGRLYQRTAAGQMVLSPSQPAPGSSLEQQLVTAGVGMIPAVGSKLADWIRGLFESSPASATTPSPITGGVPTSTVSEEFGFNVSPLPPLEQPAPVPAIDWSAYDPWGQPDLTGWWSEPATFDPGGLTEFPSVDLSFYNTFDPTPATDWGFMGLGARRRHWGQRERAEPPMLRRYPA